MKKIIIILTVILCCSTTVFAHEGPIDQYGGHYHEYDGKKYYHYHHGYDAHQHPNGVCPYTSGLIDPVEDQFKSNAMKEHSGTRSNSRALENGTAATKPYEEYSQNNSKQETQSNNKHSESYNNSNTLQNGSIIVVFVCAGVLTIALIVFLKRKNNNSSNMPPKENNHNASDSLNNINHNIDHQKLTFCHKCGAKLASDAVFCTECGTKIPIL